MFILLFAHYSYLTRNKGLLASLRLSSKILSFNDRFLQTAGLTWRKSSIVAFFWPFHLELTNFTLNSHSTDTILRNVTGLIPQEAD